MNPKKNELKNCPFCGEKVESNAEQCPSCKRLYRLHSSPRGRGESLDRRYSLWFLIVAVALFVIIIGALFLRQSKVSNNLSLKQPPIIIAEAEGETTEDADQSGEAEDPVADRAGEEAAPQDAEPAQEEGEGGNTDEPASAEENNQDNGEQLGEPPSAGE